MKRVTLVGLVLCSLCALAGAAAPPSLRLVQTISLSGVKGRFDHFALDLRGRRLFVAALGNNTLEAVDLAAGRRIRSLPGLGKPTGVLFLTAPDRLFVACGDDGAFDLFDGGSLRLTRTVKDLEDADNVRFDAKTGLIYLGYGAGGLAVVRAETAETIGRIELPAHPESFQLEKGSPRIYVNVPDAKEVAVVDRDKRRVVASWPMTEFLDNFPMALDEANHRVFIGCRKPARLLVLETTTGRRVADLAISGDIDDLFYDEARRRLYASCGEGFIDIIAQNGASAYARTERVATSPGARTCYFSPELSRLYLAVPDRGQQKAEIRVYEVR